MRNAGKKNILGVWIDAVDYDYVVEAIIQTAHRRQALAVSALAVHGVMTGVHDSRHRYRLNRLDLVVPDGQPVRWALNLLHQTSLGDRVYGPKLMLEVCRRAAADALPVYLYGARGSVLAQLARNLVTWNPALRIAGTHPSYYRQLSPAEKCEVVEEVRRSGAAITFVGLGCPRQEVWLYEYREVLCMPVIAVGAAFEFHAGTQAQAPEVLQANGLEWLFRLVHEPRRLWRRYLLLNPAYLCLLLLQAFGVKVFDPASAVPPSQELSYG